MNKFNINKTNTLRVQGRLIPIGAIYGKIENTYYYIDVTFEDNKFFKCIHIFNNFNYTTNSEGEVLPAEWQCVYFYKIRGNKKLKNKFLMIQNYVSKVLNNHPDLYSSGCVKPSLGFDVKNRATSIVGDYYSRVLAHKNIYRTNNLYTAVNYAR